MTTIMRRELNAYFKGPIGYVFLAVFYVFSGYFFFGNTLISRNADITPVFSGMFMVVLFLIPILTMRLFAEDKKYRTDQALFTAPVSLTSIVLGKYFAAVLVFLAALSITLVYGIIVNFFTPPNWGMILGNFLAMLLLGMALIAICTFISSLTESQVVAAIGGFAAALALLVIDSLASIMQSELVGKIFLALSFSRHYYSFQDGIFRVSDILFFLCISAVFLFLTIRALEKKRWA